MRPEPIKDGPETKNAGAKNAFWKKTIEDENFQ